MANAIAPWVLPALLYTHEQPFHAGRVVCLQIHRVGCHQIYMIILAQPFIIYICLERGGAVGVCSSPKENYYGLMFDRKAFWEGREGGRMLCSVYLIHRHKEVLSQICPLWHNALFKLKTTPPLPCCLVPEGLAWSKTHSCVTQFRNCEPCYNNNSGGSDNFSSEST